MNLFYFLLKQSDNIKTLQRVKNSNLSWRIVVLLLSNHSNTYTVWSELYDTCIKIENNAFLSLTTPTANANGLSQHDKEMRWPCSSIDLLDY